MKKIIAVLISVIMICTSFCSVVSYAEETQMVYDNPVIVIRGIAFMGLTIDEGTENERKSVVLPDDDAITSLVLNVAKTLVFEQRLDVDAIVDVGYDALGALACDENGNSIYNASYSQYPYSAVNYPWLYDDSAPGEWGVYSAAIEKYGAEKVYFFTYDWRLDPTDIADELNVMVERAKADNNADKVDIVCCSMGGIIADCFLAEYGCNSIDTIIFDSSAFCGTHYITELLQGKILISAEMLKYFVGDMLGNQMLSAVLYYSGIFNVVSDFVMSILNEYKGELYDKFLRDVFATMPMMWAMSQPDEYAACIDFLFPTDELKAQYSGLLARVDHLYDVFIDMDDLLRSLPANGVKVAVVGAYNTQMPPIYESGMTTGDSLLEADLMLGRATVADIGRTLGYDYEGARVSADKCIDLSNCLFPEYTWAIKDGTHIIGHSGTDSADFIMALLGSTEQPTVNTFAQYPQFMIMLDDETLLPLE